MALSDLPPIEDLAGPWHIHEERSDWWQLRKVDYGSTVRISFRSRADAQAELDRWNENGQCVECDEPLRDAWMEPTKACVLETKTCFNCLFWLDKVRDAGDTRSVRVSGQHYFIRPDSKGGFLGHGGAEFCIRFHSGRVVVSHNLWSQGHIPEHFRERLPDNAEFIRRGTREVHPLGGGYRGPGSADAVLTATPEETADG